MALEIVQIPARTDNYIYLLHERVQGITAVVDPADAAPVEAALAQHGWRLDAILNTHHHNDHTSGNEALRRRYSCDVYGYGPDAARIPAITRKLQDDETIPIGAAEARVLFVPGHTLGHIAYYFAADKAVFCGDTLFSLGCGRLFEGTPQQMLHSLRRLAQLPDDTRVFCGHEYTEANGRFALTLEPQNPVLRQRMDAVRALRHDGKPTVPSLMGQEKAANPFLRPASAQIRATLTMPAAQDEAVFAAIRQRKDVF
jgi:hydroxyacylglutathione hydrolase